MVKKMIYGCQGEQKFLHSPENALGQIQTNCAFFIKIVPGFLPPNEGFSQIVSS